MIEELLLEQICVAIYGYILKAHRCGAQHLIIQCDLAGDAFRAFGEDQSTWDRRLLPFWTLITGPLIIRTRLTNDEPHVWECGTNTRSGCYKQVDALTICKS